ncbi:hypothetical protein MKX31_28120 [Bacillus sp. FSL M8-0063]|uniref:hypothetical protein n=1 Tax=Bacillus sp. FSL M8-0063 TaxID=2921566 RepID=UPI0030FC42F0
MNVSALKFTHHAIMEMRVELQQDEMITAAGRINDERVRQYMREYIKIATYLGEIMDNNGKIDRLFAYRRYCFVLDQNEDVVITAYRRNIASDDLREIIKPMLMSKLQSMDYEIKGLQETFDRTDREYKLETKMYNALGKNGYTTGHARSLRRKAKSNLIAAKVERSKIAKGIALFI